MRDPDIQVHDIARWRMMDGGRALKKEKDSVAWLLLEIFIFLGNWGLI